MQLLYTIYLIKIELSNLENNKRLQLLLILYQRDLDSEKKVFKLF